MSDNCSDNSVSKSDFSTDMQIKYSKLASEYSKIRAQNSVLKKAVVDEQARCKELYDTVRNHEQTIRKSNQETESLNFRNVQLSRRVVVLQEELDNLQNNQKRKKGKNKNPPESQNGIISEGVLDEELKKMIMQNATLLSTLQDKEIEYTKQLIVSKEELKRTTDELETCHHKLKSLEDQYQTNVDALSKENQHLRLNESIKAAQVDKLQQEVEEAKKLFNSYVNDMNPKYEALNRIVKRHLPFIDDLNPDLNKLNVDSLQEHKMSSEEFSHDVKLSITNAIGVFHRIVQCVTVESKHAKYSELFSSLESSAWKGKTQLFKDLTSSLHSLKLMTDDSGRNANDIDFAINKFIDCFLNCLEKFLTAYANKLKGMFAQNEISSEENSLMEQLKHYTRCRNEFESKCKNISSVDYPILITLMKKLDEYMNQLYSEVSKQCTVNKNDDNPVCKLRGTDRAIVSEFKKQAVNYISSLKKGTTERIPYRKACQNQRDLRECITLQNHLKEELLKAKIELESLEKEKLRWQNEYKLLAMKYNSNAHPITSQEQITEIANELGKLTSPYTIEEEMLARENEIKKYLMEKLDTVITEKQDAYSKARTFMFESILLQKRLEYCIEEKDVSLQKLQQSKKSTAQLQEELSTVTENYELQLRTMSEHLANVNDKLASQSDTIEELSYQLNNKGSQKMKTTK